MKRLLLLPGLCLAVGLALSACGGESDDDGGTGGASGGGGAGGGGAGTGGGGGDVCQLPQAPGSCKAMIPAWWFNAATGKCEYFSYGGCDGNANNFETPDACLNACAPTVTNGCQQVTCNTGTSCVYAGSGPTCASPCPCDITKVCGCGASCPGCEDCTMVCLDP